MQLTDDCLSMNELRLSHRSVSLTCRESMTSVQSLITCAAMFKQFTVHLAVHVLMCSINYDERRPRIERRRTTVRGKALLKWYFCWVLTCCQRLPSICRRIHAWTKTIPWRMTTAASSTSSGGTLPRNDALVVVVAEVAAGSSHWSSRTYAGGRPARRWKAAPISAGGRVHGPGATRRSCPRRHDRLEWRPAATNRRRRRAISAVREAACCAVSIAQLHTEIVWTRSSSSCDCRAPIPI